MDIVEQLRAACAGHLYAKFPWPHKLLRDAADEIVRLRKRLAEIDPNQKENHKEDAPASCCEN